MVKKMSIAVICTLLAVMLAMTGCTGSQSVTATPTPVATPEAAPSATLSSTPAPTPVPSPTATQAPTSMPMATLFPGITPTPVPTSGYSWPGYDFHWTYHEPVLLTIDGRVNHSLSLTLADLKAYPQYTVSMQLDDTAVSGTGPSLIDLLNSADPQDPDHDYLRIYYNDTSTGAPVDHIYSYEYPYVVIIYSDNTLELVADGFDDEGNRVSGITRMTVVRPS